MNAVGIDVSKGKSMVAIMRPFGEIVSAPFEIKHTASDINSLVELINSVEGESRIVMEHTGRYYEALAHQLSEANLFVSAINPKLIKDFDNDSLRKVKSDKADAIKIARYALDKWQNLKQYNVMDELRNQLKTMNRQFGLEAKNRLLNIQQQKISEENVYQFLLYFDKIYDKFTDLEKKEFLNSFVEQVDIYEQEQPDGRFLKHIKFRFPVYFGDRETQELCWDNESTVESCALLSKLE